MKISESMHCLQFVEGTEVKEVKTADGGNPSPADAILPDWLRQRTRRQFLNRVVGQGGLLLASTPLLALSAACDGAPSTPTPSATPTEQSSQSARIQQLTTNLIAAANHESDSILAQPAVDPGPLGPYKSLKKVAADKPIYEPLLIFYLDKYRDAVIKAGVKEPRIIHDARVARAQADLDLFKEVGLDTSAAMFELEIDKTMKVLED